MQIKLAEILTEAELVWYGCYLMSRREGQPPQEASMDVGDHFGIDSSVVQDVVDRVREANQLPPVEW